MKIAIFALLILGSVSSFASEISLECANLQIMLNDTTLLTTIKTPQDTSMTSYSSLFKRKSNNNQVLEIYRSSNGITITRPNDRIFIINQTNSDGTVVIPNTQCRFISKE